MKKSYFSILASVCLFFIAFIGVNYANAGVYFITKTESISNQTTPKPCYVLGYKYTAKQCENQGQKLIDLCPTDAKYGKACSCDSKFKYDTKNCLNNKSLSGEVCGNKYEKCECDSSSYKYYSNADCPSPKTIDTTASCTYESKTVGYSKCSCPATFSQTCSGNLEGVGTVCDEKYASCKCKANFVKCNNGGASGATECIDNEGTKYNNCKANPSCQELIANAYPTYKFITGTTISGDLNSGSTLVIMSDITGPYTANNELTGVTIYNPAYFSSQFDVCKSDYKITLNASGKKEFPIKSTTFNVPVELVDGVSITAAGVNIFNKPVKTGILTVKSGGKTTLKTGATIANIVLNQGATFDISNSTYYFEYIELAAVGSDTGRTAINMTDATVIMKEKAESGYGANIRTTYFDSLGADVTLKNTSWTLDEISWQGTYATGKPDFKVTLDGNSSITLGSMYARGEGLYVSFTTNAAASGAKITGISPYGASYNFSLTPKNNGAVAYFKSKTGASNSMTAQTNFCSYSVDTVRNFKECTDK